jgi:tetratricopeptide (TPR) repeat protein
MYDRRLRVFVSSRMQELAPERRAIKAALDHLKVDAWIFEDDAGARPQSIQATYLDELEHADLYLGVFWNAWGKYTIDEFEHARQWKKDCLVYEKRVDIERRDRELGDFLGTIGTVETGLTTQWFQTADELAEKIQTDVARWQTTLTRQALSQGLNAERERQTQLRAQEHAAPRQRIVNLAPQGIADLFKDRTAPMAEILDTLLAREGSHRVVTIFGQGGIGKTALACRVMRKLEQDADVHGLVYLSTISTGISFGQIYRDSARMLGGAVEQKLLDTWRKEESDPDPSQKIQSLLNAFGTHRCVLLLDNVETIMDERGALSDPDLQQFLNAFLAQNHGSRLLITSREPLTPASENRKYQKVVPLDQGLPPDFAIELLRDLDKTGELELRDAPETLLKEAVDKTQGYPAALEAIISNLSEQQGLQLETLLADEALFRGSVIKNLVQAALSRLNRDGHRVMQALSVFGRPVRDVAVHYLLDPYMPATTVQETLQRLTRALYINVRRSTGDLTLHPFYREFSYNQIPAEGNDGYNRKALESRAATYYAQLRSPREAWKSVKDLAPQVFEFGHWLRAGEYDRAAEVMSSVDLDFLIWQGAARRVRELRTALDGRIQNRQLQLQHHDSLGQVAMVLGPQEEGLRQFTAMKAVATELGDMAAVGRALRGLGETSRLLGRHDDAIAYTHEALTVFRQQGAPSCELEHCLFFLGLAHCYAGYAQEAIICGQEVGQLAAARHDTAGLARSQNVLALANLILERWDEAIGHARQAIDGYAQVGSTDGLCFVGNVEAMALLGAGRHDESLAIFEQFLTRSRDDDLPRAQGLILFNQARALRTLKQTQNALDRAQAALVVLSEGQYQVAETAQALIDALLAAGRGDGATEVRRLLDCARGSLTNPDLHPPSDLAREAEASASELGLAALADEAAQLAETIRSRALRRSGVAAT